MKTIPLGQGQGEIGFGITPTNWNKGYATESPAAFCTPGSKPLASIVLPLNAPRKKASIQVMQKLGVAREGLLREHYYAGGRYWSSVIYALLSLGYEK